METHLSLENVEVHFSDFHLGPISLAVEYGKMLVILGQSGSGKSTVIRTIAGLQSLTSGNIFLHGDNLTQKAVHKRNIGMVFQDLALFPHLDVYENIAFGLKVRNWSSVHIKKRIEVLLKAMKMEGYENRAIETLSGGEKQRVALARTLAPEPEIILFDEPLSALDAKLRKEMRVLIKKIQERLGFSAIFVTHDQEEAFQLADQLAIMEKGKLLQIGSSDDVYMNPFNTHVANLLGMQNVFEGKIVDDRPGILITEIGKINLNIPYKKGFEPGDNILFVIRPEAAILSRDEYGLNVFQTSILDERTMGGRKEWTVRFAENELKVRTNREFWTKNAVTKDCFLHLPLEGITILEKLDDDNVLDLISSLE